MQLAMSAGGHEPPAHAGGAAADSVRSCGEMCACTGEMKMFGRRGHADRRLWKRV